MEPVEGGVDNQVFEEDDVFVENESDPVKVDTIREKMETRFRRQTINVMYFTMFVGQIGFSIVMSSLWPYLRKIDSSVKESYLGWVNSAYSLSQLASSVTFGYWCDRRRAIEPLLLSIFLLSLGNALYAYAEAFDTAGVWIVFGARIMLGISAGNVSICRAVVAHIAEKEHLAKTMSYLSMFQSLGFFIGPALQALANTIGDGIYVPEMKLFVNIYTAPCFLMIAISLLNFVLVLKYFKGEISDSKQKFKDSEERLRVESVTYAPISKLALIVMLIAYFVSMSVFALNETIMSPLLMNLYAWRRDETVFFGGIILAVSGILGILCFVFIAPLCKLFNDKTIILGGFVVLAVGFLIELPWGPGHLKLTPLPGVNATQVGCPRTYKWCSTTPQLPLAQYFVGGALVCIGYPIAFVLINILYAKVIGPHPQGAYMGWLSGVGSLARVIGPLYVTSLWVHTGIRWMAASTAFVVSCVIVLLLSTWKHLIPYSQLYPEVDQPPTSTTTTTKTAASVTTTKQPQLQ